MAAAIKALNAKIRSNKYTDYFCSTRTFYPDPGTPAVCAQTRKSWVMQYKLWDTFAQDMIAYLALYK
jgi:hypothetical protein